MIKINCMTLLPFLLCIYKQASIGSTADSSSSYPYATKRSRSLEKGGGSRSFDDSTNNGGKDDAGSSSRGVGSVGDVSVTSRGNTKGITLRLYNINRVIIIILTHSWYIVLECN